MIDVFQAHIVQVRVMWRNSRPPCVSSNRPARYYMSCQSYFTTCEFTTVVRQRVLHACHAIQNEMWIELGAPNNFWEPASVRFRHSSQVRTIKHIMAHAHFKDPQITKHAKKQESNNFPVSKSKLMIFASPSLLSIKQWIGKANGIIPATQHEQLCCSSKKLFMLPQMLRISLMEAKSRSPGEVSPRNSWAARQIRHGGADTCPRTMTVWWPVVAR